MTEHDKEGYHRGNSILKIKETKMNYCFGCMHRYPAGHWMYSLYDLLDNSVFVLFFLVFWVITGRLILRIVYKKFNISETVEILIIFY